LFSMRIAISKISSALNTMAILFPPFLYLVQTSGNKRMCYRSAMNF
jgi:hypothetical protein